MIVGSHSTNPVGRDGIANKARGFKVTMPHEGAYLTKLSALLDGGGSGSGTQRVRGFLWKTDGTLFAATYEIDVPGNLPLGWYDLIFPEPITTWAKGEQLYMGIAFSLPSQIVRWYGPTLGTSGFLGSFTYETATDLEVGKLTMSEPAPHLVATYSFARPLPYEEDPWYARLAKGSADEAFVSTGPQEGSRMSVIAGWHGTWLDVEPQGGSFMIVDRAGPLAEWVGERVRVSAGRAAVHAYVHRSTDLDSPGIELSLSRRLFVALAPLSFESLKVRVETMN